MYVSQCNCSCQESNLFLQYSNQVFNILISCKKKKKGYCEVTREEKNGWLVIAGWLSRNKLQAKEKKKKKKLLYQFQVQLSLSP